MNVLRSELYRALTIRSSWMSMGGAGVLGIAFGFFDEGFWSLFVSLGAFGLGIVLTTQHYQHRTAVLLFLGQPRRLLVLLAQFVTAAVFATAMAVVSGLTVLFQNHNTVQYATTLMAVPLIAVFGAANGTVLRRPIWVISGYLGWLLLVEGVIGQFKEPLPVAVMIRASLGEPLALPIFAGYTLVAVLVAGWSIRRDLAGD